MSLANSARDVLKQGGELSPYVTKRPTDQRHWLSILDEFSHACFSPEIDLFAVGSSYPSLDLDYVQPEILLVESAWNGNAGHWRYQITSNSGPKEPFRAFIESARQRGVPTVFWNKEDPVHFEDFKQAAELFDYVLTTDGDLVPQYQDWLRHDFVKLLRFAAQPRIHNPRRVHRYQQGDIAFAGQYFRHKYPERRTQMETLFTAANDYEFSIFSRMLGGDPDYQFPAPFDERVAGSLPYSEMVEEYKRHKIFLNVNSVTNSSTMCARRVYELAACKTIVVSMESDAIRSVFSEDEVLTVSSLKEAQECFQSLLNDPLRRYSTAQRAWRRVAFEHTMNDRVREILDFVGKSEPISKPTIRLYITGKGDHSVLLDDIGRQSVISRMDATVTIVDGNSEVLIGNDSPAPPIEFVGTISPEFRYGQDYLLDMVLMLRKFVPEPVVTKSQWLGPGVPPEKDECAVEDVLDGAWLARADEIDVSGLLEKNHDPVPVYLMDAHNLCSVESSELFSWEN